MASYARLLLLLLVLVVPMLGHAQSFSQYQFAPLLLNPAAAGATSELSLAANHRSQRMPELTIRRTAASLMSPVRWGGQKRLGIGIHFLSDRAEELSQFATQEIGGTLAYHHRLTGTHYLSVGGQATYRQGSLGLGEVTTGSQWVAHQGFSPQTPINESFGDRRQSTYGFSAGGLWYQERAPGRLHRYLGVAAQQLNRPRLHWLDNPMRPTVRYTAQAGWQAFRKNNISVTPEALWWREAGQQYLNAGAKISYHFQDDNPFNPVGDGAVSLITRHTVGESTSLGVQLEQPHFVMGFAYDWGARSSLEPGFQATEYGIVLRRSIFRKKKEVLPVTGAPEERTFSAPAPTVNQLPSSVDSEPSANSPSDEPDDQSGASENSERKTITPEGKQAFSFAFNETGLNEDTQRYLQDVVKLLRDNPHLRVRVVGHTDNIGTAAANRVVSIRRAETVRDFLVAQGIAAERIQAVGRGDTEPLVPNEGAASRAKNRRIELELYTQ